MNGVSTLQERLEMRARREAALQGEAIIRGLPYFEDLMVYSSDNNGMLKISNFHLLEALGKAITATLYRQILAEHTQNLLSAVEHINQVRNWEPQA